MSLEPPKTSSDIDFATVMKVIGFLPLPPIVGQVAPYAIALGRVVWDLFHKTKNPDVPVPPVTDAELIAMMRAPAVRIEERARQWFIDNNLPVPGDDDITQ